jgi:hypothetical protein
MLSSPLIKRRGAIITAAAVRPAETMKRRRGSVDSGSESMIKI